MDADKPLSHDREAGPAASPVFRERTFFFHHKSLPFPYGKRGRFFAAGVFTGTGIPATFRFLRTRLNRTVHKSDLKTWRPDCR